MNKKPIHIEKKVLAAKALEVMNKKKISSLIVAQTSKNSKQIKAVGIIHIHAILSGGI